MKKSFLFNLSILFVLNILVKPIWLLLDMQVQRETGEEYGMYFALLNLTVILNVVLDLGISNFNNRKIASNNRKFATYFSSIASVRMLLAVAFVALSLLVGAALGYTLSQLEWVFLLGVNQVLLSSILYVRSNYTALGMFKTDSFISVLDRLIMIVGVLFLLKNESGFEVNIQNFILVQLVGYLFTFFVSLVVLLKIGGIVKPQLNKRFSKTLLKKSAPYALIVLLMSAYYNSDSIMLERLYKDGAAENALYAQSFRILTALNNYAYLFAVLLLPLFSKMLKKKERVGGLLSLAGGTLIFGVFYFALITSFYGFDFLAKCYGNFPGKERNLELLLNPSEIAESLAVYKILIWGIVPMSFNYCYGVLITASGNMKLLNKIAFVSLMLNVLFNFILIPEYGAKGAALVSVITQCFSAAFQAFWAYKKFDLELNLVKPFRFALGVLIAIISVSMIAENFELLTRLVLIGFTGIFGLIISVRFSDGKSLLKVVKK